MSPLVVAQTSPGIHCGISSDSLRISNEFTFLFTSQLEFFQKINRLISVSWIWVVWPKIGWALAILPIVFEKKRKSEVCFCRILYHNMSDRWSELVVLIFSLDLFIITRFFWHFQILSHDCRVAQPTSHSVHFAQKIVRYTWMGFYFVIGYSSLDSWTYNSPHQSF